jgi:sigma54-dependent transcription regulator
MYAESCQQHGRPAVRNGRAGRLRARPSRWAPVRLFGGDAGRLPPNREGGPDFGHPFSSSANPAAARNSSLAQSRPKRSSAAPFVAVNCGAIPANLIEAELFGHEKGAFTGAAKTHRGCFERAEGGTLLLDEVTEMAPEMQVRLLRVLETGRYTRVGGEVELQARTRILAAANRDPQAAVRNGQLRGT